MSEQNEKSFRAVSKFVTRILWPILTLYVMFLGAGFISTYLAYIGGQEARIPGIALAVVFFVTFLAFAVLCVTEGVIRWVFLWLKLDLPLSLYPKPGDKPEALALRRQAKSWLADAEEDWKTMETASVDAYESLVSANKHVEALETVEALTIGDLGEFRKKRAELQKAVQEQGDAYAQAMTMCLRAKKRFKKTKALLKGLGVLPKAAIAQPAPDPASPEPAQT